MKLTEEEIRKLSQEMGAVKAYDKIVKDYKDELGDKWLSQPNYVEVAEEMADYFTLSAAILKDQIEVDHQRKIAEINSRLRHRIVVLAVVFILVVIYIMAMA
jgi:hypothetical protein